MNTRTKLGAWIGTLALLAAGFAGRMAGAMACVCLLVMSASGADITWTGSTDNQWDTSTQNWTNNADGTPVAYTAGDSVTFSGGANTDPIAISGTVVPASVNVTANGGPFYFSSGALRHDFNTSVTTISNGVGPLGLKGGTLDFNFLGVSTTTLTSWFPTPRP